jgi:c-di-GMP-binding flagellar brake protein YcgR
MATSTSAPAPSLPIGQHVSVVLPHMGGLPATVEAAEPGVLVVILLVGDSRVARLAGREVAVEAKTGRGIQRYVGRLELTPGSSERLRVVIAGEAERIQRREWARVECIVPVKVLPIGEPGGGATVTSNVSGGGCLVRDIWDLPLGTDVRVELEVEPGGQPVRALGRVVRCTDTEYKGVRFDDLSREDEDRLIRFIRDRERAALRMSRSR